MMMAIFKSSGDRETSLLAEAPPLVFADGRKDPLFSRQRTPGKEPLLAGNRETRQTTIFPGKKLEGSFFTGLFQESIKDEKVEYRVFQFAS